MNVKYFIYHTYKLFKYESITQKSVVDALKK
jgi:hypothetical protein